MYVITPVFQVGEFKHSVDVFHEDIGVTGSGMAAVVANLMKKLKVNV